MDQQEARKYQLLGIRATKADLLKEVQRLDDLERELGGGAPMATRTSKPTIAVAGMAPGGKVRRTISADQRAKQSAAATKRWAERKQAEAAAKAGAQTTEIKPDEQKPEEAKPEAPLVTATPIEQEQVTPHAEEQAQEPAQPAPSLKSRRGQRTPAPAAVEGQSASA